MQAMAALAGVAIVAKAVLEWRDVHAGGTSDSAFARQSALLAGPLRTRSNARWTLILLAMAMVAWAAVTGWLVAWILGLGAKLGADLLERELFFRGCPATRMPGGY